MEEEKKSKLKSNIIRFVLFLIIVFVIAIFFAKYLINDEFRSNINSNIFNNEILESDTKIIEINQDDNPYIYTFNKYITVLSKGKLSFYNQEAYLISELDVDITTPCAFSNSKYFAIAEDNGNMVYLLDESGIKWKKQVDGNIFRVSINDNGMVTVILKNSTYKSIVIVFDAWGNELFTTYLAKNYAICAECSNDDKYLAIGQVDYTGTIIKSIVKLISIDLAKNNPSTSVLNTYESESNKILINLKFNDNNELICMFDSYIQKITELSDEKIYDILDNDIFVDINLKNIISVLSKEDSGLFSYKYQLNLKNTIGKSDNLYILENEIPKKIKVSNNLICLTLAKEVKIINSSGWLLNSYKTANEIRDIVIGEGIIGIIYNNKIEVLSL